MAKVGLEGVKFFAYHGFYEEEQQIGGEYILDVFVETNINSAANSDDLYRTVNYETLYLICQAEMKKPSKLLEAVAQRITNQIKNVFGNRASGSLVRIKKCNPPLGGNVDYAVVEIDTLGKGGGGKGGKKGGFQGDHFDEGDFSGGGFDFSGMFG